MTNNKDRSTDQLKNLSECYHYSRKYTESLRFGSEVNFIFEEHLIENTLRDTFTKYKFLSSQSIANIWNILKYCQYQFSASSKKNAMRIVPDDIRQMLIQETLRLHHAFNSQEISNIFASLAQLNVNWHDSILDSVRDPLLTRLVDKFPEMHHLGVKLTLGALQKLFKKEHSKQSVIPDSLQKKFHHNLINAINQNAASFDAKDLHLILAGFTDLRHHLSDLIHPREIELLFQAIEKNCENISISALIKILESLSHLYHHWDDMPKSLSTKLSKVLNDKLVQINPVDLSNLLWTFSKFDELWASVSPDLKTALFAKTHAYLMQIDPAKLNPANFSKLLWSLAVLDISWKKDLDSEGKLLPVVKQIIQYGVQNKLFSDKSLIQLRQADINFDWQLDQTFLNEVEKATNTALKTHESEFERNIVSQLQALLKESGIKFQREKLIGFFTHVDVCFSQKKILEFDGSFHYNKNKKLRPKDKFKQKLLEKKDYQVERISQLDWMGKRDIEQNDFLSSKLNNLGIFVNSPVYASERQKGTPVQSQHPFFNKPINADVKIQIKPPRKMQPGG